jgi:hypothetical protein
VHGHLEAAQQISSGRGVLDGARTYEDDACSLTDTWQNRPEMTDVDMINSIKPKRARLWSAHLVAALGEVGTIACCCKAGREGTNQRDASRWGDGSAARLCSAARGWMDQRCTAPESGPVACQVTWLSNCVLNAQIRGLELDPASKRACLSASRLVP